MTRLSSFILVLLCLGLLIQPVVGLAAETEDVIPGDFAFSVSDTCTGHDLFTQISAREDGSFLLVSWYHNMRENRDLVFRLYYVDVYSPDGTFLMELSFLTKQDFVAELTNTGVVLYFLDRVITFDFTTSELQGYFTGRAEKLDDGTFSRLRQSNFQIGQWKFRCKKGFQGYCRLVRTDAQNNDLIMEFSGNDDYIRNTFIPATLSSIVIICVGLLLRRKRKHKQNPAT